MSFIELAKKRFSCRAFLDRQVEKENLDEVLDAGRVALTAANKQPQRVLVVQSASGLEKIGKASRVYGAPTVLIVCADKTDVWVRKYDNMNTCDIDASIVTDHMLHRATELGLNSLWLTWFEPTMIKESFNIPENLIPVNLLALGYTNGPFKAADRHDEERKPLSETVFYETF